MACNKLFSSSQAVAFKLKRSTPCDLRCQDPVSRSFTDASSCDALQCCVESSTLCWTLVVQRPHCSVWSSRKERVGCVVPYHSAFCATLFSIDSQRRITVGGPAVHACRSETALGCTMREAGSGSFAFCFTCFACCLSSTANSLHIIYFGLETYMRWQAACAALSELFWQLTAQAAGVTACQQLSRS
jgi:hypothetical protein